MGNLLLGTGRNHPWGKTEELLGLLQGKILQKFAAHPPPRERRLQIELFKFKANARTFEGISRRGDRHWGFTND